MKRRLLRRYGCPRQYLAMAEVVEKCGYFIGGTSVCIGMVDTLVPLPFPLPQQYADTLDKMPNAYNPPNKIQKII